MRKTTLRTSALILGLALSAFLAPRQADAAVAMLYGSDGNNFYTFTGNSSISNLKSSGWTTLLLFSTSVQANGDIKYAGNVIVTGGNYVGDSNWGANVTALKTAPTTVYRYEVCVGGAGDSSFTNIKNLIASQGTGTTSILYKNFKALKNAVPGIDAINDDDEGTFDLGSTESFARMLNGMGYQFTTAPYNNQSFWVSLKNNLGSICDFVYLQCYAGGAGNDPGQWDNAFGGGFHVTPGLESNFHSQTTFANWRQADSINGGFYWPDLTWAPNANWGVFEILNGVGLHSDTYELANYNSGLALDASGGGTGNGTPLIQWGYSGSNNMLWNMTFVGSQAKIIGVASGRAVEVAGNSTANNAVIDIYDYSGASNQLMTFTNNGAGYFTPIFVNSGKAMTVFGASTTAGASIIQYTYNGGTNAQWQFRQGQVP